MNVLIFSSSPNTDGLTAACAAAAEEGVQQAAGQFEQIRLNDLNIASCQACDNSWGTCLEDHACQEIDDFQPTHERTLNADAYVFVTPVYWGDLSQIAKAFTDRLRRCEARRGEESMLAAKPFIAIARWSLRNHCRGRTASTDQSLAVQHVTASGEITRHSVYTYRSRCLSVL